MAVNASQAGYNLQDLHGTTQELQSCMKELSYGCWRCCGKPRKFEHISSDVSKIGLRYISSAWSEGT
jgi:hypothetical protein